MPPMVRALGVSVGELLGETDKKRRAGTGPTGRMRRLFEAVSKLPRSEQKKIAAVWKPSSISALTVVRYKRRHLA